MPDEHSFTTGAPRSVEKTLLLALAVVAVSSAFLPAVRGYGTVLFQNVTLHGWQLADAITSTDFTSAHRTFGWGVAAVLSVLLFGIPAGAVWIVCRTRWPRVGHLLIWGWCGVFIALLFVLFPAIDGP